ncbi:hypothetical protein TRVL_10004 [Trypanosoma vivax]|nr:hypothetical protein TRVL_10004 [Trypanosoma vivax]
MSGACQCHGTFKEANCRHKTTQPTSAQLYQRCAPPQLRKQRSLSLLLTFGHRITRYKVGTTASVTPLHFMFFLQPRKVTTDRNRTNFQGQCRRQQTRRDEHSSTEQTNKHAHAPLTINQRFCHTSSTAVQTECPNWRT